MADKKDGAGVQTDTPTRHHRFVAPQEPAQWQQIIDCLGPAKDITSFCDVLWADANRSDLANDMWFYTRNRDTHYKQVKVQQLGDDAAVISVKRWLLPDAPGIAKKEAVCDLSTLRFHFDGGTVIDATWMPDHTVYTVMRLSKKSRSGDDNDECLPELPDGCSDVTRKASARVKEYLLSAGLEYKRLSNMWQGERPLSHTHTPALPEALSQALKQYVESNANCRAARLAISRWEALGAFNLDRKAKAATCKETLEAALDALHSEVEDKEPRLWHTFETFVSQLRGNELPAPDTLVFGEDEGDGEGACIEVCWFLDGIHLCCDVNGFYLGAEFVCGEGRLRVLADEVRTFLQA